MVVPHDDPGISAEETLIRRVNPKEHVVWDDNIRGHRLSSKLFSSSSEPPYGMSVDVLSLIVADGVDPAKHVTTPVYTGSVHFTVGAAREAGLHVGLDPLPATVGQPANPYHAEVWGHPRPERFSRGQQSKLMRASEWYVSIPGVTIPK